MSTSAVTSPPYTEDCKDAAVADVKLSKFAREPDAGPKNTVSSNFLASARGRRAISASYNDAASRLNSSENGTMTASLCACMIFLSRVGLDTGFVPVSDTQDAVGSPVMTGICAPLPGSAIWRASCIIMEPSCVFCKISVDTSLGN